MERNAVEVDTVEQETNGYWDAIPMHEPTAESERLSGRELSAKDGYAKFVMPRRSMLKTAGVLGTALALNITSAMPKKLLPKAHATVGSQYTNCTIYSYADSIICTGAPYARSYCGNDGWFLNFSSASFNSWPITVCNNRNAWQWVYSGRNHRCADGRQQVRGQSSVFRICSWAL